MDVDDTLSDRVADAIRARLALRRRRNLAPSSGKELAAAVGMSQSGMSARLTGATPIDLNDLERIARALDMEVADLLPTPARRGDHGAGGINDHSGEPTPRPRSKRLLGGHQTSRTADPKADNPAPAGAGVGPRSRPSWTHGGVTA
jgi:transcriptional regulator with XRE-family HTH domain